MSTIELRRRAKKSIDELSGAKLQFAAEFLAYVQERESEEATRELLAIPGFAEARTFLFGSTSFTGAQARTMFHISGIGSALRQQHQDAARSTHWLVLISRG